MALIHTYTKFEEKAMEPFKH